MKNRKRYILGCILLATTFIFLSWLFGWGRGNINVVKFSASEVNYVRLACAQLYPYDAAVVTDPKEIQSLIDSVNAFQHTGSTLKEIFRYGLFVGGSKLHEHEFILSNGERFIVTFSSNKNQPVSDMNLSYWVTLPDGERISGSTCKGSMETFYTLHKKYLPY